MSKNSEADSFCRSGEHNESSCSQTKSCSQKSSEYVESSRKKKSSLCRSSGHQCVLQRCCCTELTELCELLSELRCLRQKVEKENPFPPEYNLPSNEAKMLEENNTLCAATLVRIQVQRDEMCKLMIDLRDLNELLGWSEESFSETSKEIQNLHNDLNKMIGVMTSPDEKMKTVRDELDHAAWIKAVALECQEQDKLLKMIKRVSNSLAAMRLDDKVKDEKIAESRKFDTNLLLSAVDVIEKSITESKKLICREFVDNF